MMKSQFYSAIQPILNTKIMTETLHLSLNSNQINVYL